MDQIQDNHAYRCLPLSIANSHGWEILSPCAFESTWTGAVPAWAITVKALDGYPDLAQFAVSHFAYGIVTFHLGYLFRTEPGWDLFASGSLNNPKDGIAPLTGVIETDWLPYPFTMNWQMTRPGTVRFDKDEPVCMIFPVPHGALQGVEPEIIDLDERAGGQAADDGVEGAPRRVHAEAQREGAAGDEECVAALLLPRPDARTARRRRSTCRNCAWRHRWTGAARAKLDPRNRDGVARAPAS